MIKPAKTIEEVGQLAHDAWREYWSQHTPRDPRSNSQEAFTEVAKAVIAALDEGVSWAPGDD